MKSYLCLFLCRHARALENIVHGYEQSRGCLSVTEKVSFWRDSETTADFIARLEHESIKFGIERREGKSKRCLGESVHCTVQRNEV